MSLEGVTTRFLQSLAVSTVLSPPALAAPVLLGAIEHDYGSTAGRVGTTSGSTASYGCDSLQANSLIVQGNNHSNCQRFADMFDFSGIDFDSIDHFVLTLDFLGAKNQTTGWWIFTTQENWRVRPADSYGHAVAGSTGPSLTNNGPQSFSFDNSGYMTSVFDDIVDNKAFYLWFETNSPSNFKFELSSARLELYGEEKQQAVPEPSTLALFGLALIGLAGAARRRVPAMVDRT